MSQFDADYIASATEAQLAISGEDVIYTPKGGEALPRKALLNRQPAGDIGMGSAFAPYVDVSLAHDDTLGRAAILPGGDRIKLPPNSPDDALVEFATQNPVADGPWWRMRIYVNRI